MALFMKSISNIHHTRVHHLILNNFHTSVSLQLDQGWRKVKRLPENPNAFGPLTNCPDYTYLDGRPTPFGIRQYARIQKQRDILKKVKILAGEIDYAVERHSRIQREKAEARKRIIDSKLKPKGQVSLNEPTSKSTSS